MMDVIHFADVRVFLREVEAFLLEKEVENNLILGICYKQIQDKMYFNNEIMATVNDDNRCILSLFMNKKNRLVISGDISHENIDQAIVLAIKAIINRLINVRSVIGEKELVSLFAEIGKRFLRKPFKEFRHEQIYQLHKLNQFTRPQGLFRKANRKDIVKIKNWIQTFSESINEPLADSEIDMMAESYITRESLYVWEKDKSIVSMANLIRPLKSGAGINLVYTDPEYRGQGYSTGCVSSLCQEILSHGYAFCYLYADRSNPISNAMYKKIGFTPVIECLHLIN
ncbi:GNAT family N-acetyltransferase [Terrilactibacillus sp. BCM23-1]|uniref:GNAT family N-acetyltransferase n=1 Tax=Terrilactibacillus tamarindi TaxID=2599694 RepID=A0A6N8CWC9_9BACI|nr:GNAT family N-acetyltransferase [Terrilactibacillus tamarindi]MTT32916.1 GNAT family N-acetyltransferase [Terrilactibacillus tamarindi]